MRSPVSASAFISDRKSIGLAFLVFLSGAAGLIYEVVWMRMLIRVFGITLYATSTIVAVYMGGLAIGSWALGRWVRAKPVSFRLYGAIEIGVALSALVAALVTKRLPGVYLFFSTWLSIPPDDLLIKTVLRVLFSAAALAVPTILMGSTLPLLIHLTTDRESNVGSRLALYYGMNTLGAVTGILFTGFFSIGSLGEMASILVGITLSLLTGFSLLRFYGGETEPQAPKTDRTERPKGGVILGLAAASGFCALAFEIIWFRILILVLGTSVYAFSMMLALYLIGIGAGSLVARRWIDQVGSAPRLFYQLQIAMAFLGMISLHVFRLVGFEADGVQYLYSPLSQASDLLRLFWMGAVVIVPVTFVLGMAFPLLGRLVTREVGAVGPSIGSLYAWNTVGGILGAILVAYGLVPWLGTQGTLAFVCFVNFAIGWIVFLRDAHHSKPRVIGVGIAGALLLILIPPRTNIYLEILSRRLANMSPGSVLFHKEEATATLTGFAMDSGDKVLLINGILVSGKGIPGALMAHLPLLLHPHPTRALVVCFGAGNTFRSAVDHIGQVDVVELVRGVVQNNRYFYEDAEAYLSDPRVGVFIDDGRNYMLTSKQTYDVIIVDASPPIFSEGTVNLYSREFLSLCKKRLAPGGIFCLWVPIPCFEKDFWMIAQNFHQTFDHLFIWTHRSLAGVFLMGSANDMNVPPQEFEARIKERGLQAKAPWLAGSLLQSGLQLSESEINAYVRRFPSVTDDHPYTEFPLARFWAGEPFWTRSDFILRSKNEN